MLHTYLTDSWQLRHPVIGAPMAGAGFGALARAISIAGGLGMIGISSEAPTEFVEREAAIARGNDSTRFGLGLMVWAIERRPELFEAALAAKPYAVSLSFGNAGPWAERAHQAGVMVAKQVNTIAMAREAEAEGVDLIVTQGTEAGGHTGHVATLPLLQGVLDVVETPVVAAGGIATARGLAAVLAAGAQGVWAGTAFLASPENGHSPANRQRIVAASESDTVLTHTFDRAQALPWPPQFPGRALRNRFSDEWHPRADDLLGDEAARGRYAEARKAGDFDVAVIYAGQAVGLIEGEREAGTIVREMSEGAEALLRLRSARLLDA